MSSHSTDSSAHDDRVDSAIADYLDAINSDPLLDPWQQGSDDALQRVCGSVASLLQNSAIFLTFSHPREAS